MSYAVETWRLKEDIKSLTKLREEYVRKCYWFPEVLQMMQLNGNWVQKEEQVNVPCSVINVCYNILQMKQEEIVKRFYKWQVRHFVLEDWAGNLRQKSDKTQFGYISWIWRERDVSPACQIIKTLCSDIQTEMRIMRLKGKTGNAGEWENEKHTKCCSMYDRNGIVWLRLWNCKVRGWSQKEKGKMSLT